LYNKRHLINEDSHVKLKKFKQTGQNNIPKCKTLFFKKDTT